MYLTSNAAYLDRSQTASTNASAGIYVPPATYETIQGPPTGPNQQYEVLEPTPGEPRRGPPISQVTADIVAQQMFESHPPGQSAIYEVHVDEGVSSQQPVRVG